MLSDSFFVQGVTHDVCEDYGTAGVGYAIISDGCSNGGGPSIDSDWGSRLLVKAAESNLDLYPENPNLFVKQTVFAAEFQRKLVYVLSPFAMRATLLLVKYHNDAMRIFMCGDGYFGARKRDGSWVLNQVQFGPGGSRNKSAPFYPIYFCEPGSSDLFVEQFGNSLTITTYSGSLDKWEEDEVTTEFQVEDVSQHPFIHHSYPLADYDFAFVATDGLGTFYETVSTGTSKFNQPILPTQVLSVLLGYLTPQTGFLRRNRRWAFQNKAKGTFLSRNWHPNDDISMGAVFSD